MGSALEAFSASLRRRNDRFLGVNFKLSYLHNLKSYRSHLLHGNSPGHFTLKTAIKLRRGSGGGAPSRGFGGRSPPTCLGQEPPELIYFYRGAGISKLPPELVFSQN